MRADCHMHTYFSGDSEAKPEDMVLAAIDKGLEAICFTDHEDIDYFCDDIEFVFDPETYFKELGALKEKYKEKLDIRIGVEFGLQPHLAKHTELLSFNGLISITSSILRTCFSICERICSSPLATIVILVNLGSAVVPAVILSILYPRLLNNPAIRLNSPGLL